MANSRDPRTLASLVTETGGVAVEAKHAPRSVDLVIVTIPERNVPTLPKGLFAGVPASVVVVDTGNYYPRQRDGRIVEIASGTRCQHPRRQQISQMLAVSRATSQNLASPSLPRVFLEFGKISADDKRTNGR